MTKCLPGNINHYSLRLQPHTTSVYLRRQQGMNWNSFAFLQGWENKCSRNVHLTFSTCSCSLGVRVMATSSLFKVPEGFSILGSDLGLRLKKFRKLRACDCCLGLLILWSWSGSQSLLSLCYVSLRSETEYRQRDHSEDAGKWFTNALLDQCHCSLLMYSPEQLVCFSSFIWIHFHTWKYMTQTHSLLQ